MKIAVKGTEAKVNELASRLSSGHEINVIPSSDWLDSDFGKFDVVFDLNFDDDISALEAYESLKNKNIYVSAVKLQLERIYSLYPHINCNLIGINALPTFLGREILEGKVADGEWPERQIIDLGWKAGKQVEDRVGMVTPRIVCMIINEAFYTVQEGTANKEDIDAGMKLGTAYPYGPFEWCKKIGVKDVFEVLEAVSADTMDERYKICNLLRTEYYKALRQQENLN